MKLRRRKWRQRALGHDGSLAQVFLATWGGAGLAMFSRDDSLAIVDAGTPANNYQGTPGAKLTTTRASAATYWDAGGVLRTAGNGVLRRDFDPRLASTPERCGYLIEEARTNLALRSQEFDNAAWTKTDTTITVNATAAPDGTTTADLFTEGVAGTPLTNQDITVSSGATVAFSVFLKRGNTDWVRLTIIDPANGANIIRGWFNLATGAVGSVNVGGVGTAQAVAIQSVANGFYRCTLIGALTGITSYRCFVCSASADGSTTRVNSSTYYGWGAQIELGSFASSYIPTVGSTVTRAADLVTLAGTLFPLNQSEGTLYAKAMVMGTPSYATRMLELNANVANERVAMWRNNNLTMGGDIRDDNVTQATFASTATVANFVQTKQALGYKLNDSAMAQAGETVQTDIVCTMPTTTQIVFGNREGGTQPTNGWLFEAAYFPTRVSNADLERLAAAA